MIHILPYLEHTIISSKTTAENIRILRSLTDERKVVWGFRTDFEFLGVIHSSDFRIIKRLHYSNSFMPVIRGKLWDDGDGSIIDINMRMSPFTQVFMIIWLGGVSFFFLLGILIFFLYGFEQIIWLGASTLMLVLGNISMRRGFYRPAEKAKKRLEELFK